MISLEPFPGSLQSHNTFNDTCIRHLDISKDTLAVIDDLSLVVYCLVELEQLLTLQGLCDLTLFQCERVVSARVYWYRLSRRLAVVSLRKAHDLQILRCI